MFDSVGSADLDSEGFRRFREANWEWLQPYAVFCLLRRLFGTGEHWRWGALSQPTQEVRLPAFLFCFCFCGQPACLVTASPSNGYVAAFMNVMLTLNAALQMLDRLSSPAQEWYPSIQFIYYMQYHLHRQLLQASQYAASRNVALKGDLPIGVHARVDRDAVVGWRLHTFLANATGVYAHRQAPACHFLYTTLLQASTSAAWIPGCAPNSSAWMCVLVSGNAYGPRLQH